MRLSLVWWVAEWSLALSKTYDVLLEGLFTFRGKKTRAKTKTPSSIWTSIQMASKFNHWDIQRKNSWSYKRQPCIDNSAQWPYHCDDVFFTWMTIQPPPSVWVSQRNCFWRSVLFTRTYGLTGLLRSSPIPRLHSGTWEQEESTLFHGFDLDGRTCRESCHSFGLDGHTITALVQIILLMESFAIALFQVIVPLEDFVTALMVILMERFVTALMVILMERFVTASMVLIESFVTASMVILI